MSRTYGKSFDVYNVSKELQEVDLKKYKTNSKLCSWKEIEETIEKYELYLPKEAIDFLLEKKINIKKNPFTVYAMLQIPQDDDAERFIRYPSLLPKKEFQSQLMFYTGLLLSSYNSDKPDEEYGIPEEYEDLIGLLLEHLCFEDEGREEEFYIKHLNRLRDEQKSYIKLYDMYQDFLALKMRARFSEISPEKYERFQTLCQERLDEITEFTKESVQRISSFEGALGVIDTIQDKDELRELIRKLMLNERNNRGQVLSEININSYGYKRLRKKIEENKIR